MVFTRGLQIRRETGEKNTLRRVRSASDEPGTTNRVDLSRT